MVTQLPRKGVSCQVEVEKADDRSLPHSKVRLCLKVRRRREPDIATHAVAPVSGMPKEGEAGIQAIVGPHLKNKNF